MRLQQAIKVISIPIQVGIQIEYVVRSLIGASDVDAIRRETKDQLHA